MKSTKPQKPIVWIVSYPKSGNTWFRAFLTHLIKKEGQEFNLNDLQTDAIASSRPVFDEFSGVDSADMSIDEINYYRPRVYERMSNKIGKGDLFIKVHDAYTLNSEDEPIFPETVSRVAIYLVRNPLDVAVSYSFHNGHDTPSQSVKLVCDDTHGLCLNNDCLPFQLPQQLKSWSSHVSSWIDQDKIPVHVIKYEDLINDPKNTFMNAVKAMGLNFSENEVLEAIEATTFDKLKELEQEVGFHEKAIVTKSFFRKGQIGDWRTHLNKQQVDELLQKHSSTMQVIGYLGNNNEPVY